MIEDGAVIGARTVVAKDVPPYAIVAGNPAWLEAMAYSKQFNLPDFSAEMGNFIASPNERTFAIALDACMPYYFPKSTLEKGRQLISQVSAQYQPAMWWQKKAVELNFSAQWIPQEVPTLIIGSKYDCICPFSLFKDDKRVERPNVEMLFIEDAGHFVWMENPLAAKEAFRKLTSRINC